MSKGNKDSCSCKKCKHACQHKPGWFLPGEAEKVAIFLKMSLEELFNKKLSVDWWESNDDIFLLAPVLIGKTPGAEYPSDPCGVCIFYKKGLCEIHPVKPYECHDMFHDNESGDIHERVALAWKDHQDQLVNLLGRQPVSKDNSLFY